MVAAWLVGGTPIGDWLDADARATGPGQRTGDRRRSRQSWEWWSGGLPMVVVDRAAEVLSAHLPFQTTVHWTIWCAQVERPMRAPLEDEHLAPESQDLAGTIISNEAQEGRADWRHENQSQAPKHAGRFDLPCREVNPGPDCVGMSQSEVYGRVAPHAQYCGRRRLIRAVSMPPYRRRVVPCLHRRSQAMPMTALSEQRASRPTRPRLVRLWNGLSLR